MRTRILWTLILVALVSLIASCSGDEADTLDSDDEGRDAAADMDGAAEMDVDEESYAAEPASDAAESAGSNESAAGESAAQLSGDGVDRRIIRNGELELVVSDISGSLRHAREVAADYGGFVEASSTRLFNEEDESANLTIEVPSDDFDTVMSVLRDGPHVTRVERETTDSRDVTEEYVDLQSRLRNLEATESRFLDLLDEAGNVDEIMSVERELSRIRGEIEQIQGRLNYLEERTDNSRIHVIFHPDNGEEVEIAGAQFTPGESAREAWNASIGFVGAIGNVVVAIVVFFWWGWPLALIGGLVYLQYRRRRGNAGRPASTT